MRVLRVGDALAIAELERFALGRGKDARKLVAAHGAQAGADFGVRQFRLAQRGPMPAGDGKEALKELFRLWAAADGKEIDQLNEEACAPLAGAPHRFNQAAQPRQEPVVPDAQQRPAAHVADAGRLDHDGARHAAGETLVPFDDLVGHIAFLGRPPRHHGRHPGSLRQ